MVFLAVSKPMANFWDTSSGVIGECLFSVTSFESNASPKVFSSRAVDTLDSTSWGSYLSSTNSKGLESVHKALKGAGLPVCRAAISTALVSAKGQSLSLTVNGSHSSGPMIWCIRLFTSSQVGAKDSKWMVTPAV